jgi:hypothetical protein
LEFADPSRVPKWVRDFPPSLWLVIGVLLLFWSCYAAWHDKFEEVIKVEKELAQAKDDYLSEQPKFGIKILYQAGQEAWFDRRDDDAIMVQFVLEHLGGRTPTSIRFDPIISLNCRFCLTIHDIPFLSPNPPRYEHLAFYVWINGRRPEDDIYAFNKTKQASWLDNFVSDRPKAMDKCVYPLVVRYKDGNDERAKRFEIEYATKMRFFSVRQAD